MNVVYFFVCIYLLLKPFYFFGSGGLQLADVFLILAFITLFFCTKYRDKLFKIVSKNWKFLVFLILSFTINLIYFIIYGKFKFILSSLYFFFNFFAIIIFSLIFENDLQTRNLAKILKLNILIQLIIFIIGKGRYYGQVRYMGTFNDPNQFGYYILTCYMLIYLISIKLNTKSGNLIFLLITIFLILQCASTGMLGAILIFLFLQFSIIIKKLKFLLKKYGAMILITSFFLISVIALFYLTNSNIVQNQMKKLLVFDRIIEKFNRAEGKSQYDVTIVQERGYDRFIYYPQYILFGSGEGEYTRFTKTYHQAEIHATFPSILFYYGIIPTLILLSWVIDNIRNSKINVLVPFVALFLESFTLLNQRQVMFWIIIVFISYVNKKNNCVNKLECKKCENT